jgi:predicted Zn-dependent protease
MRLLFLISLLFSSLFISNCSHFSHYNGSYHYTQHGFPSPIAPRIIPVYLDSQFGEADKIEIAKALDQWNFALNGSLVLRLEDSQFSVANPEQNSRILGEGGIIFFRITSTNAIISQLHHSGQTLAFVYPQIGSHSIYLIRDRMFNDGVKPISMHELGHALGAKHVDGSLMNPQYYPYLYQCVDEITLEQVAQYQHLTKSQLNWCYYGEPAE